MHKRRNIAVRNRFGDLLGRNAGRHRNASARERLADAHDVRLYKAGAVFTSIRSIFSGMHHRKARSRAVKTSGNFV